MSSWCMGMVGWTEHFISAFVPWMGTLWTSLVHGIAFVSSGCMEGRFGRKPSAVITRGALAFEQLDREIQDFIIIL